MTAPGRHDDVADMNVGAGDLNAVGQPPPLSAASDAAAASISVDEAPPFCGCCCCFWMA